MLLLLALLFTACSPKLSPPVTNSDGPPIAADTVTMVIRDTVRIASPPVHDTVRKTILQQVAQPVTGVTDSGRNIILLPSGGDDQPQIQAAVNAHLHIKLIGHFYIYSPILVINFQGTDYGQSWCDIEGESFAENTVGSYVSSITNMTLYWPSVMIQNGKGCVIKYIEFFGAYVPPQTQNEVNTYPRSQWRTNTSDAPTHPYACIAIDPFSDPKYLNNDTTKMYPGMSAYYLSGMGLSGSTALQFSGCSFQGFNVLILITGVNQQNGECLTFTDCFYGNAMSAFASTQAQAKKNVVRGGMAWGVMHTFVDGVHYGLPHSDRSTVPDVEDVNFAGFNYQFCATDNSVFGQHFRGLYFENLFKIGSTGAQTSSGTTVHFDDCQFDFENGGPTPDWWYHGYGTVWTGNVFRYYTGGPGRQRIVLNDPLSVFVGNTFGAAPVLAYDALNQPSVAWLGNKGSYFYVPAPPYDSIVQGLPVTLFVDTTSWTGYYIVPDSTQGQPIALDTAGLTPGMLILAAAPESLDTLSVYYRPGSLVNYQTPVGYVNHINADTVFLDNICIGFRSQKGFSISKTFVKKL